MHSFARFDIDLKKRRTELSFLSMKASPLVLCLILIFVVGSAMAGDPPKAAPTTNAPALKKEKTGAVADGLITGRPKRTECRGDRTGRSPGERGQESARPGQHIAMVRWC